MNTDTKQLTAEMMMTLDRIGRCGCDVSRLSKMITNYSNGHPTSKQEVFAEVDLVKEWCDGYRRGKELEELVMNVFAGSVKR